MKDTLQAYFTSPITQLQKLDLGLTNQSYKVVCKDGHAYFVKVAYPQNFKIFDYNIQKDILDYLKPWKISQNPCQIDVSKGILIFDWMEPIYHFDELNLKESLPNFAQLLKTMHQLDSPIQKVFDIYGLYQHFSETDLADPIDLSDFNHIFNHLDNYPQDRLCHNDLVNGNCVQLKEKFCLIDFEYAANNHPYFDLMSLITENSLDDPDDRNLFLQSYFEDDRIPWDDLSYFEMIHHRLWSKWALYQYQIEPKQIYLDIALDKCQRLAKMANK